MLSQLLREVKDSVDFLVVVVPFKRHGALESFIWRYPSGQEPIKNTSFLLLSEAQSVTVKRTK